MVEGVASITAAVLVVLILVTAWRNWVLQDATGSADRGPTPTSSTSPGGSSGEGLELLGSSSGTGDGELDAFTSTGPWQLQYTFDCGNVGRPSPFAVTDAGTALVRASARSGSGVVPGTGSGRHVLSVLTRCGWVVRIFGTTAPSALGGEALSQPRPQGSDLQT